MTIRTCALSRRATITLRRMAVAIGAREGFVMAIGRLSAGRRFIALLGASVLVAAVSAVVLAPPAQAAGTTTLSISGSPNPSSVGQSVTFTAAVDADVAIPPPLGFVTFFDGVDPIGVSILVPEFGTICGCIPNGNSDASISVSDLSKGTHTISALYLGDTFGNTGSGNLMTQTVNAITTVTTVSSVPNPSVFGQGVTLSSHTVTSPANLHTIAGNVQFKVDGNNVGAPVPVNGTGDASTSVANLNVGGHTVTADFVSTDDALLDSSGTLAGGQQVNKANTSTTLTSAPNPSVFGESVVFTATVAATPPGGGSATGTVAFTEGAATLATSPVVGGQATMSVSSLPVGSHSITATYSGDGNLFASAGSTTQVVNKAPTQSTVTSSVNPSSFGQPVSFTVTVCAAPPSATPTAAPTGSVTFTIDGSGTFDTATLSATSATCSQATSISTIGLSVGTHAITTVYGGDANFTGSTGSLAGGQVVTKAPTTTTLTFVPPVPHINQAVTFTAVVHQVFVNPTLPTGTVSFYVDGSATPSATVPLVGTTATYTTTFGGGNHTVIAVYNGDANYLSSTSAAVAPNVPCDVTITGTHSALNVTSGTTCISNATITGGISVAKGAILDVENSTVSGSISANGPAALRVCGSHTGTIAVSKATGFVLIGDPTNNCAANTVAGGITATNNTGGLVIVDNTVSGTVLAVGNSGAGPLPGEGSPIVSGNHH